MSRRTLRSTTLLILALLPGLAGCRLADLRPEESVVTDQHRVDGERILGAAFGSHGSESFAAAERVSLVLEDRWESSFVRWFTPIPHDRQRLTVSLTYAIGHAEGWLLETDERTMALDSAEGDSHRIYLESLMRYVAHPFLAPRHQFSAGTRMLDGKQYQLVFASPKGWNAADDADQLLYWIDPTTERVAFVEFTYREVLRSYRGTLVYLDWRTVDGVVFPHRIRVQDDPDSTDFVHEFVVESVRFH